MRYVVFRPKPIMEWDDDVPLLPSLTVYESGGEPEPTGLLDANGNDLGRVSERAPIGFAMVKARSIRTAKKRKGKGKGGY